MTDHVSSFIVDETVRAGESLEVPSWSRASEAHWSMKPGGDELTVEARPSQRADSDGLMPVEGGWPIHGWEFHSGADASCVNIRVYSNGAEPADFKSEDPARVEYASENSEEIHICDLDAFIEMLHAIRDARTTA